MGLSKEQSEWCEYASKDIGRRHHGGVLVARGKIQVGFAIAAMGVAKIDHDFRVSFDNASLSWFVAGFKDAADHDRVRLVMETMSEAAIEKLQPEAAPKL